MALPDELEQLNALRERGALTDEEFALAKTSPRDAGFVPKLVPRPHRADVAQRGGSREGRQQCGAKQCVMGSHRPILE
jgi:hypothetical protein